MRREQLDISRSQVSKRIAALEEELGTRLIYRSPRSISLTSAGETLLGYYRHIFDTMEEAKFAVENLSNTCSGRLRFSMPTCLGAALLPRSVLRVHAAASQHRARRAHFRVLRRYRRRRLRRRDPRGATARRFHADGAPPRDFPAGAGCRSGVPARSMAFAAHPAELDAASLSRPAWREASRPGLDFRRRGRAPHACR